MSEQIKRLKRELKFKGKIIDFYQDTMEINGDHTVIWDFIKHKGAAAVVPVTKVAPKSQHLADRVREIENGDFQSLLEALMDKPLEQMQELYNHRDIEQ